MKNEHAVNLGRRGGLASAQKRRERGEMEKHMQNMAKKRKEKLGKDIPNKG